MYYLHIYYYCNTIHMLYIILYGKYHKNNLYYNLMYYKNIN